MNLTFVTRRALSTKFGQALRAAALLTLLAPFASQSAQADTVNYAGGGNQTWTNNDVDGDWTGGDGQYNNGDDVIFNFHAPPYDTEIDLGPAVRPDLTVEKEAGDVKRVPIGSTAVRAAIERYQPILALHGHVHESPGSARLGRTLCLNPGSRYNEGVLDGALVALDAARIVSHQLVAG